MTKGMTGEKGESCFQTGRILRPRVPAAIVLAVLVLLCASLFGCAKPIASMSPAELLDLGEKYLLEMNYEQAAVYFDRLIAVEPRNVRAYTGAAEAHIGLNAYDDALDALRQGVRHLSEADGFLSDAAELYEGIIDEAPDNPDAYIGLADVYELLGDGEKAAGALRRGLEALPENGELADLVAALQDETAGAADGGHVVADMLHGIFGGAEDNPATTTLVAPLSPDPILADEFVKNLPNGFELYGKDVNVLYFQNDTTAVELMRIGDLHFPSGEEASGVAITICNELLLNGEQYRYNGFYHNPDAGSPKIALVFANVEKYSLKEDDGALCLTPDLAQLLHNLMIEPGKTTKTTLGLTSELVLTSGSEAPYIKVMMTGEGLDVVDAVLNSDIGGYRHIVWKDLNGQDGYYNDGSSWINRIEGDMIKFSPSVMKKAIELLTQESVDVAYVTTAATSEAATTSQPETSETIPQTTSAAATVSQPKDDKDIRYLQEPTEATEALRSALEGGDLSGIVGTYYSEKYGYATIGEDGGITFAEVTDAYDRVYYNLEYVPQRNKDSGGLVMQNSVSRNLPFYYWNIHCPLDYSDPSVPALTSGGEILTLFPVGIEVAWQGESIDGTGYHYMPSDTSKMRLFIEGDEHGNGIDRLDADAYFIKQETRSAETVETNTTDTTISINSWELGRSYADLERLWFDPVFEGAMHDYYLVNDAGGHFRYWFMPIDGISVWRLDPDYNHDTDICERISGMLIYIVDNMPLEGLSLDEFVRRLNPDDVIAGTDQMGNPNVILKCSEVDSDGNTINIELTIQTDGNDLISPYMPAEMALVVY